MKKLLILLFSILISFNSFAGSIEGKGLVCEGEYKTSVMEPKFYWFENGKMNPVKIKGYEIFWDSDPLNYEEEGTQKILFFDIYQQSTTRLTINRLTLIMSPNRGYRMFCSAVSSKEEMIIEIQRIIDSAKKTNKI